MSQLIAIGSLEQEAAEKKTDEGLHAEIALVDRKIDDLRTYRVELLREIIRRQLRAATNGPMVAEASKR